MNRSNPQKGSALVISLILLVVMTLLGVQAMRTNLTQERMASNVQDRNFAFQGAEAALREGERQGPFSANSPPLANPAAWDGTGAGVNTLDDFDDRFAQDPAHHAGPPHYVRVGIAVPPEWRYLYPVTAIGFGGQPNTVVVVQSSFEPAGQ